MFLTAEYKQKRDNYKTLKQGLSTALTQHTSYIEQATEVISQAQNQFGQLSDASGTPNQDTITKIDKLMEKVTTFSKKLSDRNENLATAEVRAAQKYQEYHELYLAEKQREEAYHAEQARLAAESLRREQERRSNPDFSRSNSGASGDDFFTQHKQRSNPFG
ncbi:hypothetical protein [Enterococcus rivorum]|uniref:hypothetical protein n=1 Tax=Enterococcus rivorum TaxID=762845 RepID=UPI001AE8E2B3|nr:hypothetical protein [Enterococcus rivorum]MBP2100457.1 cell division septum initiation protein DivIVA [Enterococcus rivorum]